MLWKLLSIVILSLALNSCVSTHHLVASSIINGNPYGGVAVCEQKENCLKTATSFCNERKVEVIKYKIITTRRPYWERWCPVGRKYRLKYDLNREYNLRFKCCPE